jgi:3-hydroxyacyl-CoA dehydrogenase
MSEADYLSVIVAGGGEIGLAMAAVFSDAGASVWLSDPDAGVRSGAQDRLRAFQTEMEEAGLAAGRSTGSVDVVASLEAAPKDVDLAVEAGPERLDAKRALFASLRAHIGNDTPIATTSSAITVSHIVEDPQERRNCLVAHPANPPTLIRIVECVPAPETDPVVVEKVTEMLTRSGFSAVRLSREVEGFALNRLQSALLREAYRLVEAGVVDVEGADRLVSEGLGPRWALSGPFETAELNTPGGIAAHARRMGPAYARIGQENGEKGLPWPEDLVAEVSRQRRAVLTESDLPARVRWRRRALARLLVARRAAIALWQHGGRNDG